MKIQTGITLTTAARSAGAPGAPLQGASDPGDRVTLGDAPPASGSRPYYDGPRDAADCAHYYATLLPQLQKLPPAALFMRLGKLVRDTHRHELAYDPGRYLYPWVDRRPDGTLHSLYSDEPVVGGLAGIPRLPRGEQAQRWADAATCGGLDAATTAATIAASGAVEPFNCEHVVARVWFDDRQPMRGDLHHLFTCDSADNSLRGSEPLLLDGVPTVPLQAGRGAVARATLYFLLRYPGKIDCYGEADVETLKHWSREDPPSDWERHRNAAIFALQGNRNPFIDFPEWADRVDFALGI